MLNNGRKAIVCKNAIGKGRKFVVLGAAERAKRVRDATVTSARKMGFVRGGGRGDIKPHNTMTR